MRNLRLGLIAIALAGVAGAELASAEKQSAPQGTTGSPPPNTGTMNQGRTTPTTTAPITATTPDAVMKEMQQTFGFVPQWIRNAPSSLLVGLWASLKGLQMSPDTALDGKTKELIGLAVAAQIPCDYCVYFHTTAAKQNGATDQEIKEAIGMAAVTRMGSTILNGSQNDMATFRKETDRMIKGKEQGRSQARPAPTPVR